MRGNKFFAKKVYIVPGSNHRFRTEHDAKFYCQQRGIDFDTVGPARRKDCRLAPSGGL